MTSYAASLALVSLLIEHLMNHQVDTVSHSLRGVTRGFRGDPVDEIRTVYFRSLAAIAGLYIWSIVRCPTPR